MQAQRGLSSNPKVIRETVRQTRGLGDQRDSGDLRPVSNQPRRGRGLRSTAGLLRDSVVDDGADPQVPFFSISGQVPPTGPSRRKLEKHSVKWPLAPNGSLNISSVKNIDV